LHTASSRIATPQKRQGSAPIHTKQTTRYDTQSVIQIT
jgi:hypothetical protein